MAEIEPDSPLVGVVMGSRSDWETLRHASETLTALGIPIYVLMFVTKP